MWVEVAKDSVKIGPNVLCYLTNRKYSEGGHRVYFADGQCLTLLPDSHSGLWRGRLLRRVLHELEGSTLNPVAYLVGTLTLSGVYTWDLTPSTVNIVHV